MPKNLIEIIITAADKATGNIKKVDGSLASLGDKFTKVGKAMTLGFTLPFAAGMTKLALDAAPLEGIKKSFDNLTESMAGGSDAMLKSLKDSSSGMVSNIDLMKQYNLASQLVGDQFAQELPEAMGYLSKVAAATGEDMGFMMDSLVRGVGRLSPMILDNLGIQVDLNAAYQDYAAKNGLVASEMNKTQQQAALMAQVMAKLAQNTAAMPEVAGSAAQQVAALKADLKDLAMEIGTLVLPTVLEIVRGISGLVQSFSALPGPVKKGILVFGAVVAALGPVLFIVGQAITVISTLGPVIAAVGPILAGIAAIITGPVGLAVVGLIALIGGLYIAWKNNWWGMGQILRDWWASVQKFFIGFYDWMVQGGKNIALGLANGIAKGAQYIFDNVVAIGKSIIKYFTDLFDFGSPSRLFEKYGSLTIEGFAKGLSDISPVERAMNKLSGMSASVGFSPVLAGAGGGSFGVARQPGASGPVSVNLYIDRVGSNVDVEDLAYRVARRLNR